MNTFKTKLLFVFALSISSLYAQQKEAKYDYRQAAAKPNANYYQIIAAKNTEAEIIDFSNSKNAKAWKQYCRWKLYWKDRINTDGTFPTLTKAYYNAGIINEKGQINPLVTENRGGSKMWENVGPQGQQNVLANGYSNYPQMGRLTAFFRIKHPTDINQDVLFVGAPNGGVWKSTDGGSNWSPKSDFLASIGISDIKMSSSANFNNYTSKPMYVATGDYDSQHSKSIGVLKSIDGGNTFTSTSLSFGVTDEEQIGDILVLNDNTVIAGTKNYIKLTTDGGATWNNVAGNTNTDYFFARFVMSGKNIIAVTKNASIYKSDDNGLTWVEAVKNIGVIDERMATYVDSKGELFVQTQNGQIYTYDPQTDATKEFGTIPAGYKSQGGYNMAFIVEDDFVLLGEVEGRHSIDGGKSWYNSLNGYWEDSSSDGVYVHSDHHRLGKLDGAGKFWTINDGGLSYIDYGSTPEDNTIPTVDYKSSKMLISQSYSCAINPKNISDLMMSNQDNDHFSKSGANWYAVEGGDGVQSAINYINPQIRYAVGQTGKIVKSSVAFIGEAGGDKKTVFQVPVDEKKNPGGFVFPLEINQVDPTIMYAGGKNDLYKITDNTAIQNIEPMGANLAFAQSIATHGKDVVMATSESQIVFSTKAGVWDNINHPNSKINITSIDFDGQNQQIMYATLAGYNAGEKVYKSANGGKNWTNISTGLPNITINKILLYQNLKDEVLYLATEFGVYIKEGASNWTKLGQGLPNVDIKDIELHYTSDRLVAGSFGRGLWQVSLEKYGPASNKDLIALDNGFNIFPNPVSNDVLNVQVAADKSDRQYQYRIINVVGGNVMEGTLNGTAINTIGLLPNTYILQIFNQNEQYFHKFTIQK